ncbi:hypothetical protein [Streptomyces sp. ICBB 8177]|uniref:hypothetical protein n=1 Tax=Streptomyces sp. ICBB 8177 TaxID=563922 RepID=UPI000D679028|nr:hypothetical protein [Streptomyces sp. ICBB 8177]PWI43810.1 hypothetical protein CK485_17120 [Streptomyces sp. ICBB 8177]
MKISRRVTAVAVVGASALALLPGVAQAAPAAPASVPSGTCVYGAVTGSGNLGDEPISTKPGQNLVTYTTVRDAKPTALSGVFIDYEMTSPSTHKGPAPTVWWKFNGGSWHHMPMSWNPAVNGASAVWIGGDGTLGNIPGHSTRTLEMTVDYPKGAARGIYSGNVWVGAKTCGTQLLGGLLVTTAYEPK